MGSGNGDYSMDNSLKECCYSEDKRNERNGSWKEAWN